MQGLRESPCELAQRLRVAERWAAGELSSLAYLQQLNLLGGRSLQDLTQYPVFPWVLLDYDSDAYDVE